MEFSHTSVLFEETIASLLIRPDGIYVDGTLGGGGHSAGILRSLSASGVLIGIDRDDAAIKAAGERLQAASDDRVHIGAWIFLHGRRSARYADGYERVKDGS